MLAIKLSVLIPEISQLLILP